MMLNRAKSANYHLDFAKKNNKTGEIYAILGRFRPKCLHDSFICFIFAGLKKASLWKRLSEETLKSAS